MMFYIYNARLVKVDWVDATNEQDALKHAKRVYPGAAVERALSNQEKRQKQYNDEVQLWEAMNPRWRQR